MACALAQGEKEMKAMTPGEATRRGAGEKGCPDICPRFTAQGPRLQDPRHPSANLLS